MFKLPAKPTVGADVHELADFVELMAWANKQTSSREILAYLGREGENDENEGCEDQDDHNADAFGGVIDEIEHRSAACDGRYPFSLDKTGSVISHTPKQQDSAWLYCFLLLATRLNMARNRVYARIDGTALLEEISAICLKQYLGGARAKSFVFGTAEGSADFPDRVTALCKSIGEGRRYKNHYDLPNNAKDDKLDAVAWVPFADGKASKLIIFGQCKTGTAWSEQACQLRPENFIKKWVETSFLYSPVRAYCISEAANRTRWGGYAIDGGLFFDRCRLVDYCNGVDPALQAKIIKWTKAALRETKNVL